MAAEAGGIGARLRAGREKLGLTVLQVAERIHTDPRIVEAIEAENYDVLGAPVYARGHIKHYSELVGESAAELTAIYFNLSKVGQPDLTRIVKAPPPSDSDKLIAPALFVIAVFAVAGAIWWVSALSKKNTQFADTHVVGTEPAPAPATPAQAPDSGTTTSAQAPSGDRGAPPDATAIQGQPGAGTAASAHSHTAGSSSRQAPAASGAVPPATPRSTPTAVPRSAPGTPTTTRAAPPPLPTPPNRLASAASAQQTTAAPTSGSSVAGTVAPSATTTARSKNEARVTLHYSADSWTEVYDAAGARLFYDVGAANSVQTIVGTPPLRIVLGNASGVAIEFNGRNKPITKLSQPDGSVEFSINRAGQIVRSKPVADGG
jgi:cytoskeleton protein RodZ